MRVAFFSMPVFASAHHCQTMFEVPSLDLPAPISWLVALQRLAVGTRLVGMCFAPVVGQVEPLSLTLAIQLYGIARLHAADFCTSCQASRDAGLWLQGACTHPPAHLLPPPPLTFAPLPAPPAGPQGLQHPATQRTFHTAHEVLGVLLGLNGPLYTEADTVVECRVVLMCLYLLLGVLATCLAIAPIARPVAAAAPAAQRQRPRRLAQLWGWAQLQGARVDGAVHRFAEWMRWGGAEAAGDDAGDLNTCLLLLLRWWLVLCVLLIASAVLA